MGPKEAGWSLEEDRGQDIAQIIHLGDQVVVQQDDRAVVRPGDRVVVRPGDRVVVHQENLKRNLNQQK